MPNEPSIDMPVKPRVLIADDSRIVRATLIKHIAGMFDFREALDGEQAWETLLIDPSIRVLITDLTMPKLDGYGLLQRIRASKIARIRNMPVVVISGNDEEAERARAKAAGATDLITKGIGTAQLLSRLDILSKLTNTQSEFERGLETLVKNAPTVAQVQLDTPEALAAQAETMLANAVQQGKNFVVLNACIGVKRKGTDEGVTAPPDDVISAIGQMLRRSTRQTDCVAQTGEAEFTLATGNIYFDSARNFAQRVCSAIAGADLIKDDSMSFVASCGMISLSEYGEDTTAVTQSLSSLRNIARQRGMLGLAHAFSGVVGVEEEATFRVGSAESLTHLEQESANGADSEAPDLATLLQWVKEGKSDQVMQHIGKLSADLQPLLSLLNQERK